MKSQVENQINMSYRLKKIESNVTAFPLSQIIRILLSAGFQLKNMRSDYELKLGFIAHEVTQLVIEKDACYLRQSVLSLYGIAGVLSDDLLDRLYQRRSENDTALEAFLSIFNQRLWILMCESWRQCQFIINYETRLQDAVQGVLNALSFSDYPNYYFAGIKAKTVLSISDIQQILEYYFDLSFDLIPQAGLPVVLAENERSLLGRQHHQLGAGFILGRAAYLYTEFLDIWIKGLSLQTYRHLLPGTHQLKNLLLFLRELLPRQIYFHLSLRLQAGEAFPAVLNDRNVCLGRTSWLQPAVGCSYIYRNIDGFIR